MEGRSGRASGAAPGVAPGIVALVLALAGLVALASRGTPMWSLVREGPADRALILSEIVALCILGLALAVVVTLLVHAIIVRGPGAPPLHATLLRALPVTAAALAVSSLLLIARTDLGRPPPAVEPTHAMAESPDRRALPFTITGWISSQVRAGDGREESAVNPGSDQAPGGGVPLLLLVAGAVAAIAGAGVWRWYARRSAAVPPEDDDARDAGHAAVHGAVTSTIDAMLADPDPNTAIRGAYARLLEGLEASGTGRLAHEAPMEHLRRVLTTLSVRPEPLRRLTALFEVARFSTQPLTPGHRDQALEALREVADDLAGTGTVQAGASR